MPYSRKEAADKTGLDETWISNCTSAGIFVGEGVIVGVLSWLIALPISLPLGFLFSKLIADAIDFQFGYRYSPLGAVYWLLIVVTLSIISSGLPALRASRTSVREVLSYE